MISPEIDSFVITIIAFYGVKQKNQMVEIDKIILNYTDSGSGSHSISFKTFSILVNAESTTREDH